MTGAHLPIGPEEFILRRIHRNHYDSGKPLPVQPAAFRPSHADTTGLSVYREKLVSPAQVVAAGRAPDDSFVASLSVQSLRGLGLTVVTDEQAEGPAGHALIPELSVTAYQQNKQVLKRVLVELARLASQAVVYSPTS